MLDIDADSCGVESIDATATAAAAFTGIGVTV